jgi:CheY-like chemotaxis protein
MAANGDGVMARGAVLVVDDEVGICESIERILRREHEVVIATRARQALDLIGSGRRFDLILCDVMIPEMSGLEMWNELVRDDPDHASVLTFVTGCALPQDAHDRVAAAGVTVIEKPFEIPALREYVSRMVRHARAGRRTT